ncbi:MAG: hypothetical protein CVV24_06770 [Ignavibacteriae bacterium HGW-Ignavibacteriae-3]|nr:MAG: hypothetical protein CVV24_06770 [Ignavibacteriae bacterium HGW-Ignavibacteriae-3]
MKKVLIVLLFITVNMSAQEFTVDKISGDVKAIRGTSESWTSVQIGQKMNGNDLISTSEKSFIQLSGKNGNFILHGNSALDLNSIKKISLNDLLLALAMEEIRNMPKLKGNQSIRNTAVYGKEVSANKSATIPTRNLGIKKLNGAKQLALTGYKESAIIVAKETYRKYPETKSKVEDRLYFVDLMMQLNLNNEAISELKEVRNLTLSPDELKKVDSRVKEINEKMVAK